MTGRLLKCYGYCNKKHPRSYLKKFKANPNSSGDGVNYCLDCYDRKAKEIKDRQELYWYIQEEYNLTFPTGMMLRQIKKFVDEHHYTYKNIRFTLDYVFNIRKVYTPQIKFGLGFIPYFYDEMIEYYKELIEKRKNTTVKETTEKKITIKPFEPNTKYKEEKFIDMDSLL